MTGQQENSCGGGAGKRGCIEEEHTGKIHSIKYVLIFTSGGGVQVFVLFLCHLT